MLQINERKAAALALADIVRTALTTLPKPLSEALVLRFVKGKTFQEIALKQNVTLRTAFRRFDRARELFSAALDKLGLTERVFADTYLTDPAIAAAVSRLDDGAYFTATPASTTAPTSPQEAKTLDERNVGFGDALSHVCRSDALI